MILVTLDKGFFIRSFFFCSSKSSFMMKRLWIFLLKCSSSDFHLNYPAFWKGFFRFGSDSLVFQPLGKFCSLLHWMSFLLIQPFGMVLSSLSRTCYIFSSRLGIFSSLFQWLIYPLQTFLGILAQYLRWCQF